MRVLSVLCAMCVGKLAGDFASLPHVTNPLYAVSVSPLSAPDVRYPNPRTLGDTSGMLWVLIAALALVVSSALLQSRRATTSRVPRNPGDPCRPSERST